MAATFAAFRGAKIGGGGNNGSGDWPMPDWVSGHAPDAECGFVPDGCQAGGGWSLRPWFAKERLGGNGSVSDGPMSDALKSDWAATAERAFAGNRHRRRVPVAAGFW